MELRHKTDEQIHPVNGLLIINPRIVIIIIIIIIINPYIYF